MTTTTPCKEYYIASLADFLNVPAEKQADCLRDFATWLTGARNKDAADALMQGAFGANAEFRQDRFVWIDDGKTGLLNLDMRFPNGELIARVPVGGAQ